MERLRGSVTEGALWLQIAILAVLNVALRAVTFPWPPKHLVFDEKYYAPQAVALAHPKDGSTMGERATELLWGVPGMDEIWQGSVAEAEKGLDIFQHPPFGKLLMAAGAYFFPPDSTIGWRISSVIFSLLLVLALAVLVRLVVGDRMPYAPLMAGALVTLDGQFLVLGRLAMLDIFLTFFLTVGALLTILSLRATTSKSQLWLWLATGAVFSAAVSVKWTGAVWFAAALGLGLVHVLWRKQWGRVWHLLSSGVLAVVLYVVGWVASPAATSRNVLERVWEVFQYHVWVAPTMLTPTGGAAGESHYLTDMRFPWTWVFQVPDWGFERCLNGNCVSVMAGGSPVLWPALFLASVVVLALVAFRKMRPVHAVAPLFFALGVLPWFGSMRFPWVFYTVQILPFGVLALTSLIVATWSKGGNWRNGAVMAVVCLVLAMLPSWTAI